MELEHKVVLTIRTKKPSNMGPKERQVIQDSLAQRFKDATFWVDEMPSSIADWHPTQLIPSLRKTFEELEKARGWTHLQNLTQPTVLVHRLRPQLPAYYRVINERYRGYKLVDLRKENKVGGKK